MNKLLGILPFLLAIGGFAKCIRGGDASRRLTNEVLLQNMIGRTEPRT
jgi:hypothetical protein